MAQNWEERAHLRQYNYQNQFCQWKEFPRTASGLLKTNIAYLLFGEARGNDDYATPMMSYHECYTEDQKKSIAIIYDQIVALVPEYIDIHFNFTYLYIKTDKEFEYIIFCCRSSTSLNNTYFIEPNGRVYQSWQEFSETNKLPHCEYIAPQTGFYQINGEFRKYKSPAAPQGIIRSYVDWIATGATKDCLAVGWFSLAPMTVGLAHYDRYSHHNRKNFFKHLNTTAAGLTALSSTAVSGLQSLTANYGNFVGNAIKLLNYSTLASDGGLFLFNLDESCNKIDEAEFSYSDAFHLTFQTFFMCGAVTNVREMHEFLTQNRSVTSINVTDKKLTKIQKRNLNERKERNKEQQSIISDVVRVQEMDAQRTLTLLAKQGIVLAMPIVLEMQPRAEIIYNEFFEIYELLYSYFNQKTISPVQFYYGLPFHFRNLRTILDDDSEQIKSLIRTYFPNVPSDSNVGQILISRFNQVMQSAQDISDEVMEMVETAQRADIWKNIKILNPKPNTLPHQKILHVIKRNLVTSNFINENIFNIISNFSRQVKCITAAIMKRTADYVTVYFENSELVGAKRSAKMYYAMGTRNAYGLILNDDILNADLPKLLLPDAIPKNNDYYINEADVKSPLIYKVISELIKVIDDMFLTIIDSTGPLGTNKTAETIQELAKNLVNTIDTIGQKRVKHLASKQEIYDKETIYDMWRTGSYSRDHIKTFDNLMVRFELYYRCDFVGRVCKKIIDELESRKMQSKCSNKICEDETTDSRSSGLYILMSVTDKLCNKINVCDDYFELEEAQIYERVMHFVGHKFLSEMEKFKSNYEQLKRNIKVVGPNLFKKMLTAIGLLDGETLVSLKKIADELNDDEHLLAEYFEYYETNNPDLEHIKQWENTISDEGCTTYIVKCYAGRTDQYYRDFASQLFKISIDPDVHVEKNEQVVILRLQNNVVIFNFKERENNKALIVLMKLRGCTDREDDLSDWIIL